MAYNEYNLLHCSWQRAYSALTGPEFLNLLIAKGYAIEGAQTNPPQDVETLRPDGVLTSLHYNGGEGFLISESPPVYCGKVLKDPGEDSYLTSTLYHKSPWLIKAALEAEFNANKYEFFASADFGDPRIDEISNPLPQTSTGNPLSSFMYNWGALAPDPPVAKIGSQEGTVDWLDGANPAIPTGATLRTPAQVETQLNETPDHRFVRPYSEYAKYYTGGAWHYLNRDGLVGNWASPPGLWLDTWETLSVAKWDAWCSAWHAHVQSGHAPIDVMIWNGEYVQRFDQIQANSHTFAAPNGNPGRFDGPGNGIVSDSRWATTWPEIGIEDSSGNSLWHMGDSGNPNHWSNWNVYNDVRSTLFNAWEKEYRYQKYRQLVEIAKQYSSFDNTKFIMYDMWQYAGMTYECGDPVGQQLVAPGHGLEIPSTSWYGGYRAKEFRWGATSFPSLPQDAWNAFTNGISFFRSMQACTSTDKAYWMSSKGYYSGTNTDLYEEVFFHSQLMKSDPLVILYAHGIQQSEFPGLSAMLDHWDTIAGSDDKRDLLLPRVSYYDLYVLSTADIGGRFLSRLTPHPDAVVDLVEDGDGVTVTITHNGTSVVSFPTGTTLASPDYTHGHWIEQTSLITPGEVVGETYYYVGSAGVQDFYDEDNWALTSGGASGAGVPGPSDTAILDENNVGNLDFNISSEIGTLWVQSDVEVKLRPTAQGMKINVLKNDGVATLYGSFLDLDPNDAHQNLGDAWLEFGDIHNNSTVNIVNNVLLRGGISLNSGVIQGDPEGFVDEQNYSALYIGAPGGTIASGDYRGLYQFGVLGQSPQAGQGADFTTCTDVALNGTVVLNLIPEEEYFFRQFLATGTHYHSCFSSMRYCTVNCDVFLAETNNGLAHLDVTGATINIGVGINGGSGVRALILGSDDNLSLTYSEDTVFNVTNTGLYSDGGIPYTQVSSFTEIPKLVINSGAKVVLGSILSSDVKINTLIQAQSSEVLLGAGDILSTEAEVQSWDCQNAVVTYGGSANVMIGEDFTFAGYIKFLPSIEQVPDLALSPGPVEMTIEGDLIVRGTVLDRDLNTVLVTPIRSLWSGHGGKSMEALYIDPQGGVDVEDLESYYVISHRPIVSQSSIGCWNIGFRISSNCPDREDAFQSESSSGAGTDAGVVPEIRDPERHNLDRLWQRF